MRSGGLSVVFQAADRRNGGQKVALKIINIQPSEEALLRRIEREIKILSALSHPHVVGCLGSGSLQDGRPYLILEWLEGEDLSDFKQRAPMTLRRVLEVSGQIADALAAAHNLGIIHRDVKPANVFLIKPEVNARPDCRVIDFGVAKMPHASAAITRAGAILGTPSYMAPEQATYAMDVDARADVFSLGVVAFEILTGRLPWQSTTDLARLARILVEPAIGVLAVNPDVPPIVAELIDSMLRLEPKERVGSARLVHDRVAAALRELPAALLDTTFTRDKELLSTFVSEDTADLPLPGGDPAEAPAPVELPDEVFEGSRDMATEGVRLDEVVRGVILAEEQKVAVVDAVRAPSRKVRRAEAEPSPPLPRSSSLATEAVPAPSRSELSPRVEAVPAKDSVIPEIEGSEPTQILGGPRAPPVPALVVRTLSKKEVSIDPPPKVVSGPAPQASRAPGLASLRRGGFDDRLSYVQGTEARLFGRVQELEALGNVVLRPLNLERPSYTVVVGPAGIGKTRLRVELTKTIRKLPKAPVVFAGRAEESGRSSPYSFLRRMLREEVHIHSDDPPETQRHKLMELVPPGDELRRLLSSAEPPPPGFEDGDREGTSERTRFSTEEVWSERPSMVSALRDAFGTSVEDPFDRDEDRATLAAFLAQAMKVPWPDIPPLEAARRDPRVMGGQICRALDIVLRWRASKRGLVALVDDAHLADQPSAFVLGNLVKPDRNLRVVLVVFTLPNVLEEDSVRASFPLAGAKVLELEPLDLRASRELARSLVGRPLEASALEVLVKRAGGNPLFLEQLVRAVRATEALVLGDGGELALVGLEGSRREDDRVIPPTVAAAVAARISRLEHGLQRVLSTAAVFGEVFWTEGVARLLEESLEETALLLDRLIVENLVRRRAASRYRRQNELEFTHAVIRSVALARLKRKRRGRLEKLALEYLESVGEQDEATLAEHVACSGRPAQAAVMYATAAEGSLGLGAVGPAAALADEGLALAEVGTIDPAARRRLLLVSERVALLAGDFGAAREALSGLSELATTGAERAELEERGARAALEARRFSDAMERAERARELWEAEGSAEGQARARVTRAEALEVLGDGRAALRELVVAQAAFSSGADDAGRAQTTGGLARIAVASGDYRTAENRFREALVHAQAARDGGGALSASVGLAEVARLSGHLAKASELLDDARRSASTLEHHLWIEVERARIAAEDSRGDEAEQRFDRAVDAAKGRRELESARNRLVLARAQLTLSPPGGPAPKAGLARAGAIAAELREVLEQVKTGEPRLRLAVEVMLALGLSLAGQTAEARVICAAAMGRFNAEGAVYGDEPPRLLAVHARVLELAGEKAELVRAALRTAVEHADSVVSRLDRKMRKFYLERSVTRGVLGSAERAGIEVRRDPETYRLTVTRGA